jgi:uncharacterized repeat protein (TIGR03833 family)
VPPESRLKHNPFSALRNAAVTTSGSSPKSAPPSIADKPRSSWGRIVVREEFDSTEGGVITRVIGAPAELLPQFGKKWRDLFGKTVAIEGRDLLVMAAECDRIAELLRTAGANEVAVVRREIPADLSKVGVPGGTIRAQIRRGLRVAIVQKADQESGALTEGIVGEILTSSSEHPRGIKVRLESGQVGRVRRILGR